MKRIPLSQGLFALIDDEDFEKVSKYKWSISTSEIGKKYATTTIRMHRFLLNAPKEFEVDHKDGNTLNNTRQNLRLATKNQNQANSKLRKDNTSGYKGITKVNNSYRARIMVHGKFISLGSFKVLEEALNAYKKAAMKYFGEFYNNGLS